MPRLRSSNRRKMVWRRDVSESIPDARGQVVTSHMDVDIWAHYMEVSGVERDEYGILAQPNTRIIVFTLNVYDRPGPNDLMRLAAEPDRWLTVLSVNDWQRRGWRVELEEALR